MINRVTPEICSNAAPRTDLISLPELNETPVEHSSKRDGSCDSRNPQQTESKNARYSKNEDFGDYLEDSASF